MLDFSKKLFCAPVPPVVQSIHEYCVGNLSSFCQEIENPYALPLPPPPPSPFLLSMERMCFFIFM